jgi:hypothetical protein
MATFAKSRVTTGLAGVSILAIVALLYGPFINSPPFFDDANFFNRSWPSVVTPSWLNVFDSRSVSTGTFAFTYRFWGYTHSAYRVGNLLLHFLTAFSLFFSCAICWRMYAARIRNRRPRRRTTLCPSSRRGVCGRLYHRAFHHSCGVI